MKTSRQEIMTQAANQLRQEFQSLCTVPNSQLRGKEAERILSRFLTEHLPKRFACGSGLILDKQDNVSRQTDVVIYDAMNCPIYRASEDAAIFPSDNVVSIVEVKSHLDKNELMDADDKIRLVKSLVKSKTDDTNDPSSIQTMGFVFAYNSPLTLDKIAEHYETILAEKGLGLHIDMIVVLDKGAISIAVKPPGLFWAPAIIEAIPHRLAEGSHLAVATYELGLDSLDWFWRMLLTKLSLFRGIVDHPGFNWGTDTGHDLFKVSYIGSITNETDPARRHDILSRYRQEVVEEFKHMNTNPPSREETKQPS